MKKPTVESLKQIEHSGARRLRRHTVLMIVLALLVGAGIGWWWTGRPVTDSGALSPWKFVAGRGVKVERKNGADRWTTEVNIRVGSGAHLELTGRAGERVVLGPGAIAVFEDVDGSRVQFNSGIAIETGPAELCAASDKPFAPVAVRALRVHVGADSSARIEGAGMTPRQLVVTRGEVVVVGRWGKASSIERLLAPMVYNFDKRVAPHRVGAAPEFLVALSAYAAGEETTWKDQEVARSTALAEMIRSSRLEDVPTLWNLAFEMNPTEQAERKLVERMGELTGRWPAAINASKEPPWSFSFAEDWWTLIKESTAGDARFEK